MLAPRQLPYHFVAWNRTHNAPFGRWPQLQRATRKFLPPLAFAALHGPFSLQTNNITREFEYPWTFHAAQPRPGQKALEIGGGFSGIQFIFARHGCSVFNIDPGMERHSLNWRYDLSSFSRFNAVFGTNVKLIPSTIDRADLPLASFDFAYSVSVLEHLSSDEIRSIMTGVFQRLRPGGFFAITLDLFLEVVPLGPNVEDEYGTNVDVKQICEMAPFVLAVGNRSELNGFPEFDPERVKRNLSSYFIGQRSTLTQCLVLQKSP